jgi:excisionase family DNA binding protein
MSRELSKALQARRLLRVREVSDFLICDRHRVYELIRAGELEAVQEDKGKAYRVLEHSIIAYLDRIKCENTA